MGGRTWWSICWRKGRTFWETTEVLIHFTSEFCGKMWQPHLPHYKNVTATKTNAETWKKNSNLILKIQKPLFFWKFLKTVKFPPQRLFLRSLGSSSNPPRCRRRSKRGRQLGFFRPPRSGSERQSRSLSRASSSRRQLEVEKFRGKNARRFGGRKHKTNFDWGISKRWTSRVGEAWRWAEIARIAESTECELPCERRTEIDTAAFGGWL